MVWNTIAHPKMMTQVPGDAAYSPIKFADPHKLSFYDIIVTRTGTSDNVQLVLAKGDFETIKKMLLNGEAVCGAVFAFRHEDENTDLGEWAFTNFLYSGALNAIRLQSESGSLYLLSDNTISLKSPEEDPDEGPKE